MMHFERFIEQLKEQLGNTLPGYTVQDRMAPFGRLPRHRWPEREKGAKRASVLALFYPKEKTPYLVFIKRPDYSGVHSQQIAFPGGAREEVDDHHTDTALRETKEEVGVPPDRVTIIGRLTKVYIPPSNYWVQPVVGVSYEALRFVPDPTEVDKIVEVPVEQLLEDKIVEKKRVKTQRKQLIVPAYQVRGEVIWGATAMMLSELIEVLKRSYTA